MSGLRMTRLLLSALAFPALILASATACEPAPTPPHNDSFAAATVLPRAAQGQVQGTAVGATSQRGEPAVDYAGTVWFRWAAPQSGAVTLTVLGGLAMESAVYTGSTLGTLREVDAAGIGNTQFRATPGTAYSIQVASLAGAAFTLKWAMTTAPANDARGSASAISGVTGSVVADSTAATIDPTDPLIEGYPAPATIWYRWTAPADGWYEFDTHGSQVSSGLGIYADTSPAQLIDDSAAECNGLSLLDISSAAVKFQATASSSYLLMVGGSNADDPAAVSLGGPLQLNWRSVANAPVAAGNDAFAAASPISGAFGMVSGNTEGATAEPGEPRIDGMPARNSVWFSWTPPATGTYLVSSLPGLTDGCPAAVAVYTGSSPATLKLVPNTDEGLPAMSFAGAFSSGADFSSFGGEARVHLLAGTTYHVVADRLGQPGPFTLGWDIPQAAPVIRSATPGNGSIGVIWAPPLPTAGSPRSGYVVMALPVDDSLDGSEPLTLPVTSAFATIHGLRNGTAYRVMVAAINGSGIGNPAISGPVTPVAKR
jgi:hypothetical protein